jgi:hypothetical protein
LERRMEVGRGAAEMTWKRYSKIPIDRIGGCGDFKIALAPTAVRLPHLRAGGMLVSRRQLPAVSPTRLWGRYEQNFIKN